MNLEDVLFIVNESDTQRYKYVGNAVAPPVVDTYFRT